MIQDVVATALSEGGFHTEVIPTGEDAIARLETGVATYCAVLTDIHLGGKSTGWDVAKRARELNADVPVVYMTGAGASDWSAHGVPNSILLNKPFAPAQVVTAVSQLLNNSSSSQ